MYCWHARYVLNPDGLASFRAWLELSLGPLLRAQPGLREAVLRLGEHTDQLVLDSWWDERASVERLVTSAEFRCLRDALAGLAVLRGDVETRTHDPCCTLGGVARRSARVAATLSPQ